MKISGLLFLAILSITICSGIFAEEVKRTASVVEVSGDVSIKNPKDQAWQAAKAGDILNEGSYIKTGALSKAVLNIDGDGKTALVEVSEKSQFSFATLVKDNTSGIKKTLLDLAVGQVLIKAEKLDTPDSKFEVKTPTSVVGVRGTKFSVKVEALE